MGFFLCNKCKKVVKPTIHQGQVSQKHYRGNFNRENKLLGRENRLLGRTPKEPLSNFEPQKLEKYEQLSGLRPNPSCL